jgi:septum formation protein
MRQNPPVVLASTSPRREELLKLLQIEFEVQSSQVAEIAEANEAPRDMAVRLALAKAGAVHKLRPEAIIIGADTVVVCDGQVLGKPTSPEHARRILKQLSGRSHEVLTGLCVIHGNTRKVNSSHTVVEFSSLTSQEIDWYVSTGEPLDKAGAYGIQGFGARFVSRVNGCYSNVVGLPLSLLYQMLKQVGYKFDG